MALIHPHINFNGNAEEAFNFYRSVFGGEFAMVMRFKEIPKEYKGPDHEDNKIMHIALPIGSGNVLMGSDVPEQMGKVVTGTNVQISLSPASREEADKLFNGLSAGGNVVMPMSDAFWGAYFGMFVDKFGIHWMINFDQNQR